jgi:hypothetical protein
MQLAITQILLRGDWEKTSLGKIVKKVKAPFQQTPKMYFLETQGNTMFVRDQTGRVHARVDLTNVITHAQIMGAAKTLNNAAVKVVPH